MLLELTPFEISIGGVYLPPALLVVLFGFVAAALLAKALNRTRLSRFFWHPALAFLAIWVLFASLIGIFLIAP